MPIHRLPQSAVHRPIFLALACLFILLAAAPAVAASPVKNVIVMISDGAGFNTWNAASMYQGKWDSRRASSTQVYDAPGWVKLAATTYPLTLSSRPDGKTTQDAKLVYDPVRAWDAAMVKTDRGSEVSGYRWLRQTATDSAAAATAMATGVKTYNHAINWTADNRPLTGRTLPEIAKRLGKSVGTITTVPWSHATPAGLGGAHNVSRDHYVEIAREMLAAPYLDVIMGAGNPDFDDNGKPSSKPSAKAAEYVGGPETWKQLTGETPPHGWRLIQTKAQFEALVSGPTPAKLLGTAQVHSTLQQARGKASPKELPYGCPLNDNVPTLATMTRAALNALDDNPKGLYLHIEGGAVDWANHAGQPARMIEEQIDFVRAVEAVAAWVEAKSSWDETILIITADHECGMLWGAKSTSVPFDPIADNGPGKMPAMRHNLSSHTNSLVPLYARGLGSERLAALVAGNDPKAAAVWHISGAYVNNTDIFRTIVAAMAAEEK